MLTAAQAKKIIQKMLAERKIPYARLTGSVWSSRATAVHASGWRLVDKPKLDEVYREAKKQGIRFFPSGRPVDLPAGVHYGEAFVIGPSNDDKPFEAKVEWPDGRPFDMKDLGT